MQSQVDNLSNEFDNISIDSSSESSNEFDTSDDDLNMPSDENSTICKLKKEYGSRIQKYIELYFLKKENDENVQINNALKHLNCELDYIKKYIEILKSNDSSMEHNIENIKFVKEINDCLYKQKN